MPLFNYKTRSRFSDFVNFCLTIFIMLLMYKALAGTPVPEQNVTNLLVKEDVTIVKTDVILAFLPEEMDIEPVIKKEIVMDNKLLPQVPEKKVDISDLKNQLAGRKQPHFARPSRPQSILPKIDAPPVLEIGSSNNGQIFQHLAHDNQSSNRIIVPKSNSGRQATREDEILDIDKTSGLGIMNTGELSGTKPLNIPKKKVFKPDVPATPMVTPEIVIKPQIRKIAPIYPELIAWLKKNPNDFSGVVRQFMGASDEHLTTGVRFRAGDRNFEIYIACHEQQFEIRICLIEGNQTTLLIDKDFKKQSNFFRIGTIHRGEDNRIFSFGTSQESPSDSRTTEFYQVFLSWWENTRTGK
ncbi:MAG: hypothetical protein DWQ05_12270 [Calditrichaeota bacterium]|nr:MAG: hypothetical protein DWQ05_12270 [Calditrichota bacterium]